MEATTTSSTFLFCDLVGFTALADEQGDQRAAEVAAGLYSAVRPLLAPYGAEEIKTIGDAMMLRCPEAGAAIRLGVQIVDELGAAPALPPVRVGVHTGPAIHSDGDWYGATVNVAARLCSAAGGGEVLVSDQTRRGAERLRGITWGEERLHWLKNVTRPVGAHVALGRAPATGLAGIRALAPGLRRWVAAAAVGAGRRLSASARRAVVNLSCPSSSLSPPLPPSRWAP
ncbi:MAG: adenylate/guanylate cyclase domain-containing protein [Actinobacteria bacterium]|nr:MAG: adenylate/guanylate cyclase domain-containing protein [Actinomycetota bacterium]